MRSLRVRLTLWFSLAVTAMAATAAWVGYAVVRQQMISGIDFLLDAEIQELIARLGDAPTTLDEAEVSHALANGREKLARKHFDALVLNGPENVGRGGGRAWMLFPDAKPVALPTGDKAMTARSILDLVWDRVRSV